MNIQPTQTIVIDDVVHAVEDQSNEIKQMIAYLDDWRQQEADQVSALLKTRYALEQIQNKILEQLQTERNAVSETEE